LKYEHNANLVHRNGQGSLNVHYLLITEQIHALDVILIAWKEGRAADDENN
jgi:hypothetical protein